MLICKTAQTRLSVHILNWWHHTWFEFGDTLTDALNCPSTLMAQDYREKSLGVTATQGVGICMTHSGGKDLREKCYLKFILPWGDC